MERKRTNQQQEHTSNRTVNDENSDLVSRPEVSRLFDEHNATLVRYLSVRLGDNQEAAEVAQEAYIRLLNLDKPDTVNYLRAFLYKTADNIVIDRLRRRKRTAVLFDDEDNDNNAHSELNNPERQLVARQSISQLQHVVMELPPKCQKAFLLYKFHDCSYAQIADTMNLTENMVRKYVLRALEHLKDRMQ